MICLNSLSSFTNYKFNKNNLKSKKIIKGKALLFIVLINLIFLSYLIADYFYINFDLLTNLFFEGFNLKEPNIFHLSFFIFFIAVFLIFNKTKILLKKLILLNFILLSFSIWYLQINNIKIEDQFDILKYFQIYDINLINVFYLTAIEITYFVWSFLSYKSNLSDWIIQLPKRGDMTPLLKILIFYIFIIFYYSILT